VINMQIKIDMFKKSR